MTNFNNKAFTDHDAWQDIKQYIPMDKTIWEPVYDGKNLKDFFENGRGEIIISTPPVNLITKILPRLIKINKPFVLIMPSSVINLEYFRKLYFLHNENKIQIIIPKKRIKFIYYCWKLNLPTDIIWL